jgi:hypothetical protein
MTKRFSEFVAESVASDSYALKQSGVDSIGVDSKARLDTINSNLMRALGEPVLTPYIGYGILQKILFQYGIQIPLQVFLDLDAGEIIFDVSQFGEMNPVPGYNIAGKEEEKLHVYYGFEQKENGYFDVFGAVAPASELEDLLNGEDLDEEVEPIEELSKKTLKSYLKKAAKDAGDRSEVIDQFGDTPKENARKLIHRMRGQTTAMDKLGEDTVDEARIPLAGHPYHDKTDAELQYIRKDAAAAAKAMKGHSPKAEAKYLDQVNDAETVLHHRRTKKVNEDTRSGMHFPDGVGYPLKGHPHHDKTDKELIHIRKTGKYEDADNADTVLAFRHKYNISK